MPTFTPAATPCLRSRRSAARLPSPQRLIGCDMSQPGEVVEAEGHAITSGGVRRVRTQVGWVSMVAGSGHVLLAPTPEGGGQFTPKLGREPSRAEPPSRHASHRARWLLGCSTSMALTPRPPSGRLQACSTPVAGRPPSSATPALPTVTRCVAPQLAPNERCLGPAGVDHLLTFGSGRKSTENVGGVGSRRRAGAPLHRRQSSLRRRRPQSRRLPMGLCLMTGVF